jgi:hypothetical protein
MDKSRQLDRLSTGRAAPWWPRLIALCFSAGTRGAEERRLLAALDQPALCDIGIARVDALRECAKPFWQA